jgi:para-aminobenzoate synthetase/4-amino-4-deoxychorismate lyase
MNARDLRASQFADRHNAASVLRLNANPTWVALPRGFRGEAARNPNAILLETSRFDPANRHSYLFLNPASLLVADRLEDIPKLFREIEIALDQGLWVAGYLSYECGYHFEHFPNIAVPKPLAWFGVYQQVETFDHFRAPQDREHTAELEVSESTARCEAIAARTELEIPKETYVAAIARIKEHLAAGNTYQVNFTDRLAFNSTLSPAVVFSSLSSQQHVAYSAFLNIEGHAIVSLSPELFFKTQGDRITTRPMKGTMPRGLDPADDERMAELLRNDEKNCSEHVMIVDLLRNDLGRICRSGSIEVENPFSVERYDTLHQMTSTVVGSLRPGITFYDIFRGLFPSGSITGAPKHRTMQIIHELERKYRGVYTGAIGFISPNRSSVFNVAIRTLVMQDGEATMGVGGGIVADSKPEDEYRECLLKASFLTRPIAPFQLIETLLWDGEFKLLNLHLERMESSALYFGFPFDRSRITSILFDLCKSPTFERGSRQRIRLTLAAGGRAATQVSPCPEEPAKIRIWLAEERISSTDPFRRHKTTRRDPYDRLYKKAREYGFTDVIFANENGDITEGAISNVFIERAGKLLTPPVASGLLPGVLRRHILETRDGSQEAVLSLNDLRSADAIYLCSSLRGLRQVTSFSTALDG